MSTRYHQAAIDGYLDILKEATRKDVNTTDADGMSPLLLAAYHGHLDVLEVLCNRGGDPNKSDIWGNTPLHHAAEKGHANCVAFLVNFGSNIFALDNKHHSPLDMANLKGRTDCVRILDEAANKQTSLNPKRVAKLKEQALKDAERKVKECEKIQDKHQTEMNKTFNRNKTGTVNSAKGTLSGSVGARFSTPSTISSLSKGLRDTLQLKIKKKDKNTIDQNTVTNIILAKDESSGGHRTKVTDVFSESNEGMAMEEGKQSIFNRPGLGNMVFKRNLAMGINTDFGGNFTAEDERTLKVKNALFAADDKNEIEDDGENINIAWNDDDEMEIDEEEESSPLKVFLESYNLLDLHVTLLREKIDLDSLLLCSNEDLQSINIQLGPRKKLLSAVEKRNQILKNPGKITDTKL
ncbi:PREDICTED: ankyrin repeat and SAM domain-containing protein 4B [Nanorana parkeri]|uniref:ankyrin repeat and SAM domain-containing protein 4B n=1 Tax=Nanorana parkeri TaxID=125878 RepID=UPI000854A51D|nr:PREDICTED: ankyrin repeat and SAM domain-containing protein 4B [Nanorana parkeri]